MLTFLDPVIAFGVASHHGDHSVVRVHLTLEGLPPWDDEETFHDFVVPLRLHDAQCRVAAAQWERDLLPFPLRAGRKSAAIAEPDCSVAPVSP